MEHILVHDIQKRREQGEDLFLLDVRTHGEHTEICIPDTLNIPLDELPTRHGELPQNKEIYVYCASGNRSQSACDFLEKNGFARVYNVDGGIMSWHSAGLPVKYAEGEEGLF